jgi:hypothetical protein
VDEAEALLFFFHDLRAAGLPQSFLMVKRARSSASLACAESEMELSKRRIRRTTRRLGMATGDGEWTGEACSSVSLHLRVETSMLIDDCDV